MYRDRNRSIPVAYYWLKPKKKDFSQTLSTLLGQGAIYRMTAPSNEGCDNAFDGNLVFERKLNDDGKRRKYQTLKLIDLPKFFSTPAKAGQTIIPALSEKTLADFEKLLNEGYQFRDLYNADGVYALFEREVSIL